jgi:hypothetical protein
MIFSLFGATVPGGFIVGGVFSSIFSEFVWWPEDLVNGKGLRYTSIAWMVDHPS